MQNLEMIASPQEIYAVLREFNPWWENRGRDVDLPPWRRAVFPELMTWIQDPPSQRAVLLSGARQVGKTTLLRQAISQLIADGISPQQILYATFDHPLLKLTGLEQVVNLWQEFHVSSGEPQYLFLDEVQNMGDWQVWLKHQVDFKKKRRIAVTGSAIPLGLEKAESGVGRWHTIKLPTLSFFEYLKIQQIEFTELPQVTSLRNLFTWSDVERIRAAESARPLIPHFHQYLLRGGFPETVQVESLSRAQKLLREDIVDKVLKRDMTALYGVRNILELEKVFLYLCLHDGGILDITQMSSSLEMKRPTVTNFLMLLESAHLIYRLQPFGYGKEKLKGQHKVYLADPAIPGSVLLKGESLLEDNSRLGRVVETAFFKHLYSRYYDISVEFSYWRQPRTHIEVDVIAEIGERVIPFEVKYQSKLNKKDFQGLDIFCHERSIDQGYLITRELSDFSLTKTLTASASILSLPAILACYWLSRSELRE